MNLQWELRKNNRSKSPWAYGRTTTDSWDKIQEVITRKDEWNKAELAFRLAQVINPSLIETVQLWPDSMLESHQGFGDNKATLTFNQIVNGFAKTTAHEFSHTLGLQHPIQVGTKTPSKSEIQKLVLNRLTTPTKFRLEFQGVTTKDITFDPDLGKNKLAIWKALAPLRTIGYHNYIGGGDGLGIFMAWCESILRPTKPQDSLDSEQLEIAKNQCQVATSPPGGTDPPKQTFLIMFSNHLEGYDLDQIKLVPSSVGSIQSVVDGITTVPIKEKKYSTKQLARVPIPGVEKDIMYGGYNDVTGKLSFQSGVSLEPLKMALGLNYTKEDVDKVVKLYKAQGEAFESWKPGDVGFLYTEKKPTKKK